MGGQGQGLRVHHQLFSSQISEDDPHAEELRGILIEIISICRAQVGDVNGFG